MTIKELCLQVDEIVIELDLALDALSIAHESLIEHHPKAERHGNAICSTYLTLCAISEKLQELTTKAMEQAATPQRVTTRRGRP